LIRDHLIPFHYYLHRSHSDDRNIPVPLAVEFCTQQLVLLKN
jgi:hypothetical protein